MPIAYGLKGYYICTSKYSSLFPVRSLKKGYMYQFIVGAVMYKILEIDSLNITSVPVKVLSKHSFLGERQVNVSLHVY